LVSFFVFANRFLDPSPVLAGGQSAKTVRWFGAAVQLVVCNDSFYETVCCDLAPPSWLFLTAASAKRCGCSVLLSRLFLTAASAKRCCGLAPPSRMFIMAASEKWFGPAVQDVYYGSFCEMALWFLGTAIQDVYYGSFCEAALWFGAVIQDVSL
jgi:hypothetical protein